MPEKQPQYINSISRALHILELYGKLNVEELGIAEISKMLGLQKTSTFNIVKTLQHEGWLLQDAPGGKYRLGTRVMRVSAMVIRSMNTDDLILREMHRLRDVYNENVVLTALLDDFPICVEKVQAANILKIQSKVGRRGDFFHGSTGRCLFAWQPDDFVESVLKHRFPETEEGRRDREKVRKQIEGIRGQGYCSSASEQDAGVASVTAPILNSKGYAIYSLGVVGEENRMKQKGIENIAVEVIKTARELSEELQLLKE